MTHQEKINLCDRLDKATNEIEDFLNNYDFDFANENDKKYFFDIHWTISSLNARLMAKLTKRYEEK